MAVKCDKCGYEKNSGSDKFCLNCGGLLHEEISKSTRPLRQGLRNYTVIKLIKSDPGASDFFISDDKYHLGVETIEGVDLETIMEKEGRPGLPEDKIVSWTKDILAVLEYLHNESPSILYKYIKPYNIIVSNGRARLKDLDFVRTEEEKKQSGKRKTEIAAYVPIEQIEGKEEARSDLYALGATIYHLLTGITPRSAKFDPLSKIIPSISPELEDFVKKATEEKLFNRFSSAKDMKETIENISVKRVSLPHELRQASSTGKLPHNAAFQPGPAGAAFQSSSSPVKIYMALLSLIFMIAFIFVGWIAVKQVFKEALKDKEPPVEQTSTELSWINKGDEKFEYKSYEEALEFYDRAINKNPASGEAWRKKADCLVKLERYEEAVECYNNALNINPDDSEALENKDAAFLFLRDKDYWNDKGIEYDDLGEYKKAIECYDKALEIDPDYVYPHYNKGLSFSDLGDYEQAIESYNKAIELDPKHSKAWYCMGNAYDNLGNSEKALECYDRAIEINPNYADAWNNKAYVYIGLEKYEEGLECCEKSLEIDPDYTYSWYNKGICLENLGRYKEALICYNKALSIDSSYEPAQNKKDKLLLAHNDLDPEEGYDEAYWNDKGMGLSDQGKHEEAIECYDKSIKVKPSV